MFESKMLSSPTLLCSLHDRPINLRDKILRQKEDFNQGAGQEDQEDGRLVPQNNHLSGV